MAKKAKKWWPKIPFGPGNIDQYDPTYPEKAYALARKGLIDEMIAARLGIGHSTLCKYYKEHPELVESVRKGKAEADAELVERQYDLANNNILADRKGVETQVQMKAGQWLLQNRWRAHFGNHETVDMNITDSAAQRAWEARKAKIAKEAGDGKAPGEQTDRP